MKVFTFYGRSIYKPCVYGDRRLIPADAWLLMILRDNKDLFDNRTEVLDHLFYDEENDLHWSAGTVVCKGSLWRNIDEETISRNVKKILKNPHQCTQKSNICNIPSDIRKDWLDLAMEAKVWHLKSLYQR